MYRTALILSVAAMLAWSSSSAQQAGGEKPFGQPISEGGGVKVYVKMDFDKGDNPFANEASGTAALEERPDYVVSGRSLHVKRVKPGGYFGARTQKVAVQGSRGLNIAFCVRSKNMLKVSLNLYDALKRDNTTPSSPARVTDDVWRTVVLAVEDFHHNSNPPQRKVPANTKHTNLFFHGQEAKGGSGEYWIDKFVIYRGRDTQPPEAPAGLKAVAGKDGAVQLSWKEPADNVFPAVYSVYRKDGGGKWAKVAESVQPRCADTVAAAGKYSYRVTAADYDGNVSKPSEAAAVSVGSAGKPAAPTTEVTDRLAYADNVRAIHARGAGKVRHDVFLFHGDSITAADAYAFSLDSWLARGIVVRRGTGMMTTKFGRNTIAKELQSHRPEFAVVMWGTNDSKSAPAVKQAMENLSALIDTCADFGTVPILATIPPRGFNKDKQDGQVRFNAALVKLCRAKKVPISYCFEEMMKRDLKQMLGDGTHLRSGPGNDAAGETLLRTMRQVCFALRDTAASWKP